jgi:hypothetical protein
MGFAGRVTGVNGLLPGDGPCLEREGPPTLARDPRFGALSDDVCPQPDNPVKSIRLRDSIRHDRDGDIFSNRSGGVEKTRCIGTGCIAGRFCMFCWL